MSNDYRDKSKTGGGQGDRPGQQKPGQQQPGRPGQPGDKDKKQW